MNTPKWCGEDHPHSQHYWNGEWDAVTARPHLGAPLPEEWTHCPGSTGYDIGVLPVVDGDTVVLRYKPKLLQGTAEEIVQRLKPRLPDGVELVVISGEVELNVVHKEAS
jgi:hypothetical protein